MHRENLSLIGMFITQWNVTGFHYYLEQHISDNSIDPNDPTFLGIWKYIPSSVECLLLGNQKIWRPEASQQNAQPIVFTIEDINARMTYLLKNKIIDVSWKPIPFTKPTG